MIIEYYQGLRKTLFFHWLVVGEWKKANCYPKLFNKYLLFSSGNKIFWEFYQMFYLNNLFEAPIETLFNERLMKV